MAQDLQQRFQLLGTLGVGGMGVVQEAYDQVRAEVVALKTLDHLDPWRLYCLKNEFRTLADVVHPNLVALHELIHDGQRWVLVLERVRGRQLNHWLHEDAETASTVSGVQATTVAQIEPASERSGLSAALSLAFHPLPAGFTSEYFARVRYAFGAITQGIAALHASGILHRDLKPSNVMVEDGGRVVILDFGLAIDRERSTRDDPLRRSGTWEYLSPERIRGEPAREASDWYALGVMLYRALTGFMPYFASEGYGAFRVSESGAPHLLDPNIPQDLSVLTVELLREDPEARPGAREILVKLGALQGSSSAARAQEFASPLFGRERELGLLERALAEARAGEPRVVRVLGESGIGKTALLDVFAQRCAAAADVLFLRSRCLAAETSPYKGVDGLVDALALVMAARADPTPPVPAEAGDLIAMFPLLTRVPGFELSTTSEDETRSERARRRRAVSALAELCRRVAEGKALVLCIDDAQWGDEDGADIVLQLLSEGLLSRTLVIVSSQPKFTEQAQLWEQLGDLSVAQTLVLGPLSEADCGRWVEALVQGGELREFVPAIVRTSAGYPMFVMQLVQSARERRELALAQIDLPSLVGERLSRLNEGERELIEVLALVARPLAREALSAIGVAPVDGSLRMLQAHRWIRASGPLSTGKFEISHDKLRTLICESVPADLRRARHARIAMGLAADESVDPELLSDHFERAGMLQEASYHAVRAGHDALELIAFARAAAMFERARALHPVVGKARYQLLHGLASAYQGLGRGQRAAEAWSEAAALADDRAEALELERRAAEQWLTSGEIEKGLTVLQRVMATVGIHIPRTRPRALAELVYFQTRLSLAGGVSTFAREDAGERFRADALFAASRALSMLDLEFSLCLQTRYHWHASRSGDRERHALALAWSACFRGVFEGPDDARFRAMITNAEALAQGFPEGLAPGFCALACGTAQVMSGRYAEGIAYLDRAEQQFRGRRGGSAWERMFTRVVLAAALAWSGQLARLGQELEGWLLDADDRGDNYTATMLRLRASNGLRYLARDDPGGLLAEVERQLARWPKHRMAEDLSQRYAGWLRAFAALASGRAALAREHLAELERGELIRRALTPHALRAELELLRGLIHVAAPKLRQELVQRSIARLEADPRPYGSGFAHTLRAALELRAGRPAHHALAAAERAARDGGLAALAASASTMQALLASQALHGPDGRTFLRAQGAVHAERFARFWFAPWTLEQR